MHVNDCDYETLLALADQMSCERFNQIKLERPEFAAWLDMRHALQVAMSSNRLSRAPVLRTPA
jgi:hypothetical protein